MCPLVCSISFCGCKHVKGQPTRSNGQSNWPPLLAATLSAAALALPALAASVCGRAYPLAARSAWQRHWLRHGVAAAAAAGGLYLLAWRGDDVRAWALIRRCATPCLK